MASTRRVSIDGRKTSNHDKWHHGESWKKKENAKASEEGLPVENGGRTSFSFKVIGRIASIFKKIKTLKKIIHKFAQLISSSAYYAILVFCWFDKL